MSDGQINRMKTSYLGIRNMARGNWLPSEEGLGDLTRLLLNADSPHPMTAEDWASEILEPQLADSVPTEIRRCFELARGSLLQGYFFYPLGALGTRQLSRAVDLAIEFKCRALHTESINTSQEKIRFLVKSNFIPEKEEWRWHWKLAAKDFNPSEALGYIFGAAGKINSLFALPSEES